MSFESREASGGVPTQLLRFESVAYGLPTENDRSMSNAVRGVCLLPGATEAGLATTLLTRGGVPQNGRNGSGVADIVVSLDELQRQFPAVEHVTLVVAWHGTSTDCAVCQIRPMVEERDSTSPFSWRSGPVDSGSADLVPRKDGKVVYGSAPSDRSIYEAVSEIKRRGLRVTLLPFILMVDDTLSWRGRITSLNPMTAQAVLDVSAFVGTAEPGDFSWNASGMYVNYSGPDEWSYRRFIFHCAEIARVTDVDGFLIGSEMVGLTKLRSDITDVPFASALESMLDDINVGSAEVGYAANWDEYFGIREGGDAINCLDGVWAHPKTDFIGIDLYQPVTDWRDGVDHLDYTEEGITGSFSFRSGENYDWYYASQSDRDAQIRTPITDGAYGEPEVFRSKDIWSWWSGAHHNRVNGVRLTGPTAWVPESKPIRFTEYGFSAIDKSPNQPNLFVDPRSSENGTPHYSSGLRDDAIQQAAIEELLYFMSQNNPASSRYDGLMLDLDNSCVWGWDARSPWDFPADRDFYGDAVNWPTSHILSARVDTAAPPVSLGRRWVRELTTSEQDVFALGGVFKPTPLQIGAIVADGSIDDADLEIKLPRSADLAEDILAGDPSAMVHVTIYEGHLDDPAQQWLAVWAGRLINAGTNDVFEVSLRCVPGRQSMRRTGLRRTWQRGCPHALYGFSCRANRKRATRYVTVQSMSGRTVTLSDGWEGAFESDKFNGGLFEWMVGRGPKVSNISTVEGNVLTLERTPVGLEIGQTVAVVLGCSHQRDDCANLHNNIHNFGGAPFIPLVSPFGANNSFF